MKSQWCSATGGCALRARLSIRDTPVIRPRAIDTTWQEGNDLRPSKSASNTNSCASSAMPAGMRSWWRSVANAGTSAQAAARHRHRPPTPSARPGPAPGCSRRRTTSGPSDAGAAPPWRRSRYRRCAPLERVYGRGPGAVDMAKLGVGGIQIEHTARRRHALAAAGSRLRTSKLIDCQALWDAVQGYPKVAVDGSPSARPWPTAPKSDR